MEPVTRAYKGDDPLGFVVSANLHRRHLDDSQRGMIGAQIATLKLGRPANGNDANLRLNQVAEMLNVSARTINDARAVREQASPDLVKAVERGKVAVSAAKVLARLSVEEQFAIASAGDKERAVLVRQGKQRARALPKPAPPEDLTLAVQTRKKPKGEPAQYTVLEWNKLSRSSASGSSRKGSSTARAG